MRNAAVSCKVSFFTIVMACTAYTSANATSGIKQVAVPPPPLGWSSWNSLGNDVDQVAIEQQADALVQLNKNIADKTYRYRYVNTDGGWWLTANGNRNASGGFALNPNQWDSGSLGDLVAHIHKDGLLAGIYTDAGKTGCGGQNGSEGYYIPDMLQFAEWGFDYVKVDYCGGRAEDLDPLETYSNIAQAIQYAEYETGRSILFSVCNPGQVYATPGFPDSGEGPWSWAPGVGDLPRVIWRSSDDITGGGGLSPHATFQDVLNNFHSAYHPQAEHTGYYNDPDMMVAGLPGVDADPANPLQSQAHMSLWAISGAPMIQGANLVTIQAENDPVVGVLTNQDVIKVDQDPRGLQGIEVATPAPGIEIWAKLLAGSGQRALVVLNETTSSASINLSSSDLSLLGLNPAAGVSLVDLWSQSPVIQGGASSSITLTVPAQTARMLSVSGTDLAPTTFQPDAASGPGRNEFQIATTSVSTDPDTFQMQNGINHLDIAYSNPSRATRYSSLSIAGQPATTVAFPSTGTGTGTVTIAAPLTTQGFNDLIFSTPTGTGPAIHTVSLVAGPVPVFTASNEADASGNTLSGTAVVQSCATCYDGKDVGFIGSGGGSSGTLTINNVTVPAAGQYTLLIAYTNADSVSRVANVSVNGGAPTSASFPIAGKDYDTIGVFPLVVTLNAGSNSITFANPTGYGPDIVALDVKTP